MATRSSTLLGTSHLVLEGVAGLATVVEAMQNGAASFLEKPFTVEEVTDALDRALAGGGKAAPAPAALTAKYDTLTPREREVMLEIIKGGAWSETNPARLRAAARVAESPDYTSSDLGFRCASEPGPDGG